MLYLVSSSHHLFYSGSYNAGSYLISSEKDKFWWSSARAVLSEILEKEKDPQKIWRSLNDDESDLSSLVSGFAKKIIGKNDTAQASGVTGSSLLEMEFLKFMNVWAEKTSASEFSLSKWTKTGDGSFVFLTFRDIDKAISQTTLQLTWN